MKLRHPFNESIAFTITELLVVLAALALLAITVLADVEDLAAKAQKVNCYRNLHLVGICYRIWSGDFDNKYPAEVPATTGGAMEAAGEGKTYAIFQTMRNEINDPKILICPADTTRTAATNFVTNFDNSHVSYFAGLKANLAHPAMLLSGDSNISVDGNVMRPGLQNLASNAPVAWASGRHVNAGNIGLADGSVMTPTTLGLKILLVRSGVSTNQVAVP